MQNLCKHPLSLSLGTVFGIPSPTKTTSYTSDSLPSQLSGGFPFLCFSRGSGWGLEGEEAGPAGHPDCWQGPLSPQHTGAPPGLPKPLGHTGRAGAGVRKPLLHPCPASSHAACGSSRCCFPLHPRLHPLLQHPQTPGWAPGALGALGALRRSTGHRAAGTAGTAELLLEMQVKPVGKNGDV